MTRNERPINLFRDTICLMLIAIGMALPTIRADTEDTQKSYAPPTQEELEIRQQFNYSFNDISDNLVIIESQSELGDCAASGFIAKADGKTYIFTNQHVIMGMDSICFKSLTGKRLKPKAVELSATRDIARLLIDEQSAPTLTLSERPEMNIPIAVFGNSEGGGVATEIYGMVNGVGADLVEVSAEFVAGNSGSPVLNPDKQVIGIASYVHFTLQNEMNEGTKFEKKARRFCYRLSHVDWVLVNWRRYNEKHGKPYLVVKDTVESIFDIIDEWANDPFGRVPSRNYPDSGLNHWASIHNRMVDRISDWADEGSMTQSELDNTNKRVRKEIQASAHSLSTVCKRLSKHMKKRSLNPDLTGFLRDEFESYADALDYASLAVDLLGEEFSTINYFRFY